MFFPYDISKTSGTEILYLPKNTYNVRGSTISLKNVNTHAPTEVPMKSIAGIVKEHKLSIIDVLKMDIEGEGYAKLGDILEIKQFCIKFHYRMFNKGAQKTKEAINLLNKYGYVLFRYSL